MVPGLTDASDVEGSSPSRLSQAGHRHGIWPLVSGAEMQALDRLTIESLGIPSEVLMESAGRALIRPALELRRACARADRPIRAFCGAGNNGGDGFVAIRHLWAEGVSAEAILVGDPTRLSRDAAVNWKRLAVLQVPCRVLDPNTDPRQWARLLSATSVAIDALFGTGLKREITGGFAHLIAALSVAHARGLQILAVDIPSGISAHTGRILGTAVEADRTVTISLPKVGLALEPGRSHAGRIEVARVGILDPDPERLPRVELWNARAAVQHFPARPRAGHKGSFGHVLVVAGSRGLMGAAVLCSRGCLRAGSGLVSLAHPGGLSAELAELPSEVMTAEVAATPHGGFARAAEKTIEELAASRDVIVLGPGLGRDTEAVDLVRRLVISIDRPLVLDADGLFALGGQLDLLRERGERSAVSILTPHPGEAARLLETDVALLASDRVEAARQLARRSGSIVVLKGAGTVVAEAAGRAVVIPTGGPALASGGTGDVLTGIIAALLAAKRPAFEAAVLGAWWHGASADRLDGAGLGFGVVASQVADGLPECAAELFEADRAREPDAELDLRFPGP